MATKIADLYVKLGADTDELDKSLKEASGKLADIGNIGKKFESVGKDLSLYVTAPLVAIGSMAIKAASDVQKGISEVVTLFGATGDEATKLSSKLSKGVGELSNELGVAQDVLVNGLYNAISAGVPEDNVFDFMKVATKASIAGVTDVNTAVDGITTGLNAFGLEASEAGRVADSMFAAVQGGKTTFEEMSQAMFNVAPAAAAAGVSMEEVNAGIATLTASGVPTSVATTQLRAALTGLQRPSEDLNQIFQSLGYESAQMAIESEGLGFALDAVKNASGGSNGRLQELLGSVEAVSAANIIAGTGAEKFAQEMERQANATGLVNDAFEVMSQTTAMQMEKTKVLLQNVGISIGSILLPAFNNLLGSLQGVFNWFNGLSESTKEIITYIGLFAAALGPLLLVIGKVMTAISSMQTVLTTIKVALAGISAPVLATVAAVTALAAIGLVVYKNWEPLTEWFGDKFPKATQAFTKVWDSIKSAVNNAINTIKPQIDKIIDAFSGIFASDGDIATEASAFDGLITTIFESIGAIISTAATVIGNVFGVIASTVAGFVNTLRSAFNTVRSLLRGDFEGAWNSFKDMLSSIWNTIVTNVLLSVDSILAAIQNMFGWIPGAEASIAGFREKMKGMIPKEPIQADGKAVEATVKGIDSTSKATTGTVKELGDTSVQAAAAMATGFASAGEQVKSMSEIIKEIFKTLGEETAAGKRELAFILKLDRETELKNEIAALETALKALANETTIDINDERVVQLQYSLGMARQELEGLAEYRAFEDKLMPKFEQLRSSVENMTLKELADMRTALTKMDVPENGKVLFDELQTILTNVEITIRETTEEIEKMQDAFDIDQKALDNWQFFQDELFIIDRIFSGEDNLRAKIEATNKAIADGRIPLEVGGQLIAEYNMELKEMNSGFKGILNQLPELFERAFPNTTAAFRSAKDAAESFKQVFKKENGKTPLENISDGFNSITDAIGFGRLAMNEFGNTVGIVIGALELALPGVGTLIASILGLLKQLGIDVEGILNSVIDKLGELFGGGGGTPAIDIVKKMLSRIVWEINTALQDITEVRLSPDNIIKIFDEIIAEGGNFEDFIAKLAETYQVSVAEIMGAISPEDIYKLKMLGWTGLYDPDTGQPAFVSEELKKQILARLEELRNSEAGLSPQEILDVLIAEFGKTALKTLGIAQMLGLPPEFAQGGMVTGETLAIVGDNPMAQIDPEVISPLSKLKSMLVNPTLAAISSMTAESPAAQYIYLTVDGRVLTETVVQGMPEYVRLNLGSGY